MTLTNTQDAMVRRYDYDDRTEIVVDFGPGADPTVDVLSDTAIVAIDGEEHDIALPEGSVEAFNHNGVVTFRVRG